MEYVNGIVLVEIFALIGIGILLILAIIGVISLYYEIIDRTTQTRRRLEKRAGVLEKVDKLAKSEELKKDNLKKEIDEIS